MMTLIKVPMNGHQDTVSDDHQFAEVAMGT